MCYQWIQTLPGGLGSSVVISAAKKRANQFLKKLVQNQLLEFKKCNKIELLQIHEDSNTYKNLNRQPDS